MLLDRSEIALDRGLCRHADLSGFAVCARSANALKKLISARPATGFACGP
jgi:hypothetical protein